jgi:hypothetical protein
VQRGWRHLLHRANDLEHRAMLPSEGDWPPNRLLRADTRKVYYWPTNRPACRSCISRAMHRAKGRPIVTNGSDSEGVDAQSCFPKRLSKTIMRHIMRARTRAISRRWINRARIRSGRQYTASHAALNLVVSLLAKTPTYSSHATLLAAGPQVILPSISNCHRNLLSS